MGAFVNYEENDELRKTAPGSVFTKLYTIKKLGWGALLEMRNSFF
jgi:hypothetical protein